MEGQVVRMGEQPGEVRRRGVPDLSVEVTAETLELPAEIVELPAELVPGPQKIVAATADLVVQPIEAFREGGGVARAPVVDTGTPVAPNRAAARGAHALPAPIRRLVAAPGRAERLLHVRSLPPRAGRVVPWPSWVEPDVVSALRGAGIRSPWTHQVEAADLAWGGRR
jgi:hypothetical protein